jgi:hypothetical protein
MNSAAPCKIKPKFTANKLLAVNKSNKQHDEIKNRIRISQKSNALHLSQMNIDIVMPEVSDH